MEEGGVGRKVMGEGGVGRKVMGEGEGGKGGIGGWKGLESGEEKEGEVKRLEVIAYVVHAHNGLAHAHMEPTLTQVLYAVGLCVHVYNSQGSSQCPSALQTCAPVLLSSSCPH